MGFFFLCEQAKVNQLDRRYLREEGKVLDDAGTLLVENSNGQQGHASAEVLECQVEASALGQRPETPDLRVHLHQPSAKVDLGETLIGGDGVHLRGRKKPSGFKHLVDVVHFKAMVSLSRQTPFSAALPNVNATVASQVTLLLSQG